MTTQGITIIRRPQIINVKSAFPIFPNFVNFSIKALNNGQTQFTLPSYPILSGLFSLNYNGAQQDELNGDFTVNGNIVTINSDTVLEGDKIAGFYQEMSSAINPANLSYRTFFYTAIQGQTVFNIGFIPQNLLFIAINGIVQPTSAYTISGQNITLTGGLNAGDNFFGLAIQ